RSSQIHVRDQCTRPRAYARVATRPLREIVAAIRDLGSPSSVPFDACSVVDYSASSMAPSLQGEGTPRVGTPRQEERPRARVVLECSRRCAATLMSLSLASLSCAGTSPAGPDDDHTGVGAQANGSASMLSPVGVSPSGVGPSGVSPVGTAPA